MAHRLFSLRNVAAATAILLPVLSLATVSHADTISYSGSGNYSAPGEPYPNPPNYVFPNPFVNIPVQQFNPSLGTLTGVSVSFTWSLTVSDTCYATTSSPQTYWSDTPGELDCNFPGSAGTYLAGLFTTDLIVGSLDSGNNPAGPVPGGGSLGGTASGSGTISGPVAPSDLSAYQGTGTETFFVAQGGVVNSNEQGGNYFESSGSNASATVTVTYTYTPSSPPPVAGPFVTYTQGGWATSPHGQNPGYYLTKYFTSATGGSIAIGVGNSYTFTSAAAIENFLPQGGGAKALPGSKTNPSGGASSVIWGQLLAAKLSVAFSNASVFSGGLGALKVQSGPFKSLTCAQVIAIGDAMVGGSALPAYTPAGVSINDENNCLNNINNCFDNGTTNTGFLK